MNGPYFAGMDESGREQPTYTLPGVLHFIKHEWAKFERERATWDSERAEFQVRLHHIPLMKVIEYIEIYSFVS